MILGLGERRTPHIPGMLGHAKAALSPSECFQAFRLGKWVQSGSLTGISQQTKVPGAHTLGMLPKPIAPFLSISICSSRLSQLSSSWGTHKNP